MEIKIKHGLSHSELNELGVENWPLWQKDKSEFPWTYNTQEKCYILSGRAQIICGEQKVIVQGGDYIIFPKGAECVWKIIEPLKKHYIFT